jgi:Peptidase A4 family
MRDGRAVLIGTACLAMLAAALFVSPRGLQAVPRRISASATARSAQGTPASPSATDSASPDRSATPTEQPKASATPAATDTPTETPRPSESPTVTPTREAAATPAPTAEPATSTASNTWTYKVVVTAPGETAQVPGATLGLSQNASYPALDLSQDDSGKTAAIPVGTLVFIRMGGGDFQYTVDPASGVLDALTGEIHLPGSVTFALTATGPGTATITVTGAPSPGTTAGMQSYNWSGYMLQDGVGAYNDAFGYWVVPAVQKPPYGSDNNGYRSATWVGIDGWNSDNLIQVGTSENYDDGGTGPSYYAWWYILGPGYDNPIGNPVQAGDFMSGEVKAGGACGDDPWTITLVDHTQNWNFTTCQTYGGSGESAEWIEEATGYGKQDGPLPDFDTVTFCGGTVNGAQNPGLVPNDGLYIAGRVITYASPSAPNETTNGFSVGFEKTPPVPPAVCAGL